MREKFRQILMRAFEQKVMTIHINGNGSVIFEQTNRLKCKKIQMIFSFSVVEAMQLIQYIKIISKVELYEIKPCDYFTIIDGYCVHLHVLCIPSMYVEEVILRIVSCSPLKIEMQNTKIQCVISK